MLVNEKELIDSAKKGDHIAFARLISDSQAKLLSVASGLVNSKDEAEDVYQDAMLSAYKALPQFREQSQFSTWLYRIVVNTAISSQRKLSNRIMKLISTPKFTTDGNESEQPIDYAVAPTEACPEGVLVNQQLNRAINQAIASLSEKERIAFVLCHQQEFKISDASLVMECGEGSVKSYLFRARDKMRTQLQGYMR
ncbi:RNA polymerase sigma factor [Aliikangiella sp. IMCC44653]